MRGSDSRGRHIGVRELRREDRGLLVGAADTVADLTMADLAEVAFVRAGAAHGRLAAVRTESARTVPDVLGAWSAADLPGLPVVPGAPRDGYDWPALACGKVRYAGEPVAVVAASRRATAEDGADRVEVEIEPLPGMPTVAAATGDGAARLFDGLPNVVATHEVGSVREEAFATAAFCVEGSFREQRVIATPMEARAVLARPEPGGGLTVWVSHQAQHRLQRALCAAFGLADDDVRVVVPAVGGAFGTKSQCYPEYLAVCRVARELGRPVRWVEDRREALLAATRGRGQDQRVRLAADADGRFVAYDLSVDADIGGYPHTGAMIPTMTAAMATGAYRTPEVRARTRAVLTTTAPTSAYRGAGRPEAAFAIERSVDILARRMGIDPAELRRRNFLAPADFPYRTPTDRTYDSGNYRAALDKALDVVGYEERRREQAARRASGGRPLGIGMATYVERAGGPPDSDEHGSVEACPDGRFVARSGSTATGQGHLTAFAQVVASVLDVDLDRVTVVEGDTAEVPYGFGSFGSRSMQVGGEALAQAASGLIDEARKHAATGWGVAPGEVEWHEGTLVHGDRSVAVGDLARREGLRVDVRASPPLAFPFGAYVAVVEIDPDLGCVDVQRLVAVDDYGVVVNPLIVDGQGYGSVAQGLGQALLEEATVDVDGVPAAASLLEYLLPVAGDMPPVELQETETPNPNTWTGAKGAGEAGCIGVPPAIVNAVCDALGVEHLDMPLTPEVVWRAAATVASTEPGRVIRA